MCKSADRIRFKAWPNRTPRSARRGTAPTAISGPRPLWETGFTDVGFGDVREPSVFGTTAAEDYALMSGDGSTRGLLEDLSHGDKATALDQLRAV